MSIPCQELVNVVTNTGSERNRAFFAASTSLCIKNCVKSLCCPRSPDLGLYPQRGNAPRRCAPPNANAVLEVSRSSPEGAICGPFHVAIMTANLHLPDNSAMCAAFNFSRTTNRDERAVCLPSDRVLGLISEQSGLSQGSGMGRCCSELDCVAGIRFLRLF